MISTVCTRIQIIWTVHNISIVSDSLEFEGQLERASIPVGTKFVVQEISRKIELAIGEVKRAVIEGLDC